ncbi:MAG: aldo/keto reductase [Verrucomicrobiota bacterium]
MSVKRVPLSKTGPELSEIAFGTWRILDGDVPSPSELADRIRTGVEHGITTLDTAEIYGLYEVERALGEALATDTSLRDSIEIITKCGIDVPSDEKSSAQLPHYNATAQNLMASAEKSLKLLGVEQIDLMLVHRPDWFTSAEETARGLNELVKSGKVAHVGVSNYTWHQFELLDSMVESPLVTNQVEVNLFNMDALYDGTLAQCEQKGIRPMAWSVLGGGRFFEMDEGEVIRIREVCAGIRDKYDGASDEALATAWVMNHPSRPLAITGSNKTDRIIDQAQATNIKLDRQDWYALWSAAKGCPVP